MSESRSWKVVRAALLTGMLTVGLFAGWQIADRRPSSHAGEYGDTLIHQGILRFQSGDFPGAVNSWESYLHLAPVHADTISIREMINEAESALAAPPKARPPSIDSAPRRRLPSAGTKRMVEPKNSTTRTGARP